MSDEDYIHKSIDELRKMNNYQIIDYYGWYCGHFPADQKFEEIFNEILRRMAKVQIKMPDPDYFVGRYLQNIPFGDHGCPGCDEYNSCDPYDENSSWLFSWGRRTHFNGQFTVTSWNEMHRCRTCGIIYQTDDQIP